MPVFGPFLDELYHFLHVIYYIFLKSLNIHPLLDVFPYLEVHRLWLKQVHDLFVVDLQIAALDQVGQLRAISLAVYQLLLGFNILKDVLV
jgi:hypothetical protein